MLRLEFYPAMAGVQMRATGIDLNRNPDGSKKEPQAVERIIRVYSIEDMGLAGAIAEALWSLHREYPALHEYARR